MAPAILQPTAPRASVGFTDTYADVFYGPPPERCSAPASPRAEACRRVRSVEALQLLGAGHRLTFQIKDRWRRVHRHAARSLRILPALLSHYNVSVNAFADGRPVGRLSPSFLSAVEFQLRCEHMALPEAIRHSLL